MTRARQVVLLLTVMNVVWGSTFFLTKRSLEALAVAAGPPATPEDAWAALLGLRFALAAAVAALVFRKALGDLRSPALWRDAVLLGIPSALGFALQTAGLALVSPGTSAFLTSLYVPFTPLAAWLLFRHRLPRALFPALALALAGLWILSPPSAPGFGWGGILSAACGAVFAVQIVVTDRLSSRQEAGAVTTAMFVLMAAGFLAAAWALPSGRAFLSPEALGRLAGNPSGWLPIAFNGTVASVFPFWAMNRFQKHLDPNHAAVVYATEPLFAAGFSALWFGERFGPAALAGGLLVVGANLWAGKAVAVSAPR